MLFCREPMGVVRFGPALAGSAWPDWGNPPSGRIKLRNILEFVDEVIGLKINIINYFLPNNFNAFLTRSCKLSPLTSANTSLA